jgi:uncharacterized protein (DUF2147 family)
MQKKLSAAFLAIAALTALPAHAADVFGTWLTENKKAIVEIKPCAASACGNIVWMAEPNGPGGQPKTDANNPDPSLSGRTICGMPMVGNFTKDAEGEWSNGFIYDPEGGDTYKSKMRLTEEGNLYVRGYVGIPLLGKSQVWTREADNRGGC